MQRGVRSTRSSSARISAGSVNGLGSPTSTPRKSSGSGASGGGGSTSPPTSPMNPGVSPSAAALLKLARSGGSGSGLIGGGSAAEGEGAHLFVRMQMWIVQEHLCGLGSLQVCLPTHKPVPGSPSPPPHPPRPLVDLVSEPRMRCHTLPRERTQSENPMI